MQESKRQSYKISIRQNARKKVMDNLRMRFNYDCPPINQLAKAIDLPPKQKDYSIGQIISQRWKYFIFPSEWLLQERENNMTSEQCQQKNRLIRQIHTDFWSYLVKDLYLYEERLTNADKPEIYKFLVEFISKNKHITLAKNKSFELKVINAIELALYPAQCPKQLKKVALKWVTGTDGLVLLCNAMISQFLDPNQYKNVYMVIDEGLNLTKIQDIQACCELLIHSLKNADLDDIYSFYQMFSHIMTQLLNRGCHLMTQLLKDISNNENKTNNAIITSASSTINIIGDAAISIANCYNSVVVDYARMGFALLGSKMINFQLQSNIIKGLQILRFCSEIPDRQMIVFLLHDEDLKREELWKTILQSRKVLNHRNIQARRLGYEIINSIMANGELEEVLHITAMFEIGNEKQSLIQFLKITLEIQCDNQIIKNTLSILIILIYYGNITKQMGEENVPLMTMINFGMHKLIEKITEHENEKISDSAVQIMKSVSCFYENNSNN